MRTLYMKLYQGNNSRENEHLCNDSKNNINVDSYDDKHDEIEDEIIDRDEMYNLSLLWITMEKKLE